MDALSRLLVIGDSKTLQLVKTMLTSPMLINTGKYQGLPFSVALETNQHDMVGNAEVSESLVVAADQKVNIADNIAPGPWEWNLAGYIGGIDKLEPTNYFKPFVAINVEWIKRAFKGGYILTFKDNDNHVYSKVVIKALKISTQADSKNKVPFSMTIKEINTMDTLDMVLSKTESAASLATGTIRGAAKNVGLTVGTALTGEGLSSLITTLGAGAI